MSSNCNALSIAELAGNATAEVAYIEAGEFVESEADAAEHCRWVDSLPPVTAEDLDAEWRSELDRRERERDGGAE